MRIAYRVGMAVVTVLLAIGPGIGHAGAPPKQSADPPVDEGLLEFLGSVDPTTDSSQPDDGSWLAYLSQIEIDTVGKTAPAQQSPAQRKPASPASGADKPGG